MDLYSLIIAALPELAITLEKDLFKDGTIKLNDDGDGVQYISEWNYSKPLPESLTSYLR
jgi:hypothetical protein